MTALFLAGLLVIVWVLFYTPHHKIILGYCVPEDLVLSPSKRKEYSERLDKLDVVAYAFLQVSSDGKIAFSDNDLSLTKKNLDFCELGVVHCGSRTQLSATAGYFEVFSYFHLPSRHLKRVFSLGGADNAGSFFNAIDNIDTFLQSVSAVMDAFQLSGIDLDFEINRPYKPNEAAMYADLIASLRKRLGPTKLISMTTISDLETLNSLGASNWKIMADHADLILMMCYDFNSPFIKPYVTGFSSNLYLVKDASKNLPNYNISCDQSIQYLVGLGVPIQKIVLGVPAYGIAYGGVGTKNDGLFQPSALAQTPTLDNMGKGLLRYSTVLSLNKMGFQKHTTTFNDTWSYHPEKHQFITYDDLRSIQSKVHYIIKNNLAGMMVWRIGQDVPVDNQASLLREIDYHLH